MIDLISWKSGTFILNFIFPRELVTLTRSLGLFRFLVELWIMNYVSKIQFSSVTQLCPTLCDPMDCQPSVMPGFPVLCHLPELTQTHDHRDSDAIQPPHPLSSPSPPTFSLSQHQGLFQWVSSSHQVAKVLEFQLQHLSFQLISRTDFLQDCPVGSSCSPRDSQESSPTPQFKSIISLTLSFLWRSVFFMVQLSHPYMTTRKTIALTRWSFVGKVKWH